MYLVHYPFDQVSEELTSQIQPRHLVIAERFHSQRHVQAMNESTADFDAALRKLATYCEIGGTSEKTLRDRFVCGLHHEAMQCQLITDHALTYQRPWILPRAWKLVTATPDH